MDKHALELVERIDRWAEVISKQSANFAELAAGLKVNGVLYSGTKQLSSSGRAIVEAKVNFAAATVRPAGADVTIAGGGGDSGSAPTQGPGVFTVPGGIERTVALAGNVLVLYGTPGALVDVTLWINAQPPSASETHPQGVDATAASPARIAGSIASVVLAAANPARRGLTIFNEGAQTLNVALAPVASSTIYTLTLASGGLYTMAPDPFYRGIVSGIFSAATGAALVTELQ
jgi:hypothetical protein